MQHTLPVGTRVHSTMHHVCVALQTAREELAYRAPQVSERR